ncbi:MAG: (2Fe-2S)-binding protein [Bacteroidales bacterium]|jgi:aerobic-type carbon monoxide dehydrogenase small subunit (CoxS/CutS family)|nr:(2Fe-2S)-binding protein [Bacteroidales bacterium]MCU0407579.1 (2Fe-2S)-binding protein [Bacteroidales bacterium]
MEEKITFNLNGKPVSVMADPTESLLWVIRDKCGLTGTKFGCGMGFCGSCTVLIDNEPVRSCSMTVGEAKGKKIVTIEGLAKNGKLHPLQKAFVENDALQCGFCTPGMIMNATGLLMKNPSPTTLQIKEGMEDNLCRCGAHVRIIDAVHAAAKEMKGGKK